MKSEPRGPLERHLPRTAPAEEELLAMRGAAWRKQGIIMLKLSDVDDTWVRQAIENEANRLYGRREVA